MSYEQIAIVLALTAYAIYRQTVPHPVIAKSRFKLALIYCAVGLVVGGFRVPVGAAAWTILVSSLLSSAAVGVARGRMTELSRSADGSIMARGTPSTVALFLLLIAFKFALGAWQYLGNGGGEPAGFGELLVLIGVMVAIQAEIVWRRARNMTRIEERPIAA